MGTLRAWLDQNWFNLVQTLGIMASGLLATVTLRRETRARRLGDYLTVIEQHPGPAFGMGRHTGLARHLARFSPLFAQQLYPQEIPHGQTRPTEVQKS